MTLKYNFEITSGDTPDKRFIWSGVGDKGGVHIWAQFKEKDRWGDKCYGGIEVHSLSPMYDEKDPPSHDECWLLNAPCWHDGSSLYFSENLQSLIEDYEDEPERLTIIMEAEIFDWYRSRFGEPDVHQESEKP